MGQPWFTSSPKVGSSRPTLHSHVTPASSQTDATTTGGTGAALSLRPLPPLLLPEVEAATKRTRRRSRRAARRAAAKVAVAAASAGPATY
jgi:hypothetical protein